MRSVACYGSSFFPGRTVPEELDGFPFAIPVKQSRFCFGPVLTKLNFPNLIRISATVVEVKYPGNDLPTCMYVLQDFGEVGLRVLIHMMGTL